MKRAVVLGATGHIGAHVVRALLAKGYAVRAVYRNPRHRLVLDGLPVEQAPCDIEEAASLRRVLEGCTLAVHCAGYYPRLTERRERAIARGLTQIRRVFEAFRASRLERIVYVSSAATIAPQPDRLSTEADQEPWPLAHWKPLYATVKIAMEHAVLRYHQHGLPVVIVNPSFCIGEHDAHPFSGRLVLLFARGTMPVYLDYHLNVVYTGDVAVGTVAAAEHGQLGARYLLAHQHVTLGEFAQTVARIAGVRPPRWCLPHALAMAAATLTEAVAAVTRTEPLLPRSTVRLARHGQRLDPARARRELGLPQTPMEEAIRRALAWFRQHGYR